MNLERWRTIDRIFSEVLEVAAEERHDRLLELTRDDSTLRPEVEALLRGEAEGAELLERVAELASASSPPLQEGDRLDHWRIGPLLGAGGSGVVFEAERVDQRYERRVAIKVLQHALLTDEAIERFRRECQVLARLDHSHIARLEDAGSTASGLPYLVLERVDGLPLDQWCERHRPTLDERLVLLQKVASGVAFAHRNLVVHRDLKPSNVLVTADGQPKLLDFGIARVLAGGRRDWTRLTVTRGPMTPQFASPEQLQGREVSTASDVYSLGLLLYQLVTGRLPYILNDLGDETVARLVAGDLALPAPSSAARGAAEGAIPAGALRGDLDTIILTALEVDPERRFRSAQALADEIDRFRSGLPILARAPSVGYVLRRFVGRHRLGVAAGVAIVAVATAMVVSLVLSSSRLRAQEAHARRTAGTAQEVTVFLSGLFEGAEPAVHQGRHLNARELLDRGAATFEQRTIDDPGVQSAVASAIGKAYLELSAFPEARSFLEQSQTWRETAGTPVTRAENLLLLSRLDFAESHFEAAEQQARRALDLLADSKSHQAMVDEGRVLLGRALMARGKLDAGEAELRSLLAASGRSSSLAPGLAGLVAFELGSAAFKRGQFEVARGQLAQAVDRLTLAHGELHPQIFEVQRLLFHVESTLDPAQAAEEPAKLRALLERQKRVYGDAHEQMMWTLTDLASSYTLRHQDDLAEGHYREALAMQDVLLADDHMVLAIIHAGLGHVARRREDLAVAIDHFERSLVIAERSFAADSIDLAYPRMTLGHALSRAGRCREAADLLEAAHRAFDAERREGDFSRTESLWGWGYARDCLGDAEGREMMWQALDQVEKSTWKDNEGLKHEVAAWVELTPPRPDSF
ncbi:MAG: protein kinase [Acidobacteriota bacterium]